MKKLVAYFSATGTTKKLATNLAEAVDGDLFEIKPKIPYSDADLDWTNNNSRSTVEMKDVNSRPEIENKLNNLDEYDTIFVGFPIWWYVAPHIINSFLEQYDLSNKTIIPFATSGGSNMGETNRYLKNSCKGANLLEGKRLSSNASVDELKTWVNSL